MSRVEENQKQLKMVSDSLDRLNKGDEQIAIMMLTDPGLVKVIVDTAQLDILTDISKSLAMIADDLHYYRQYESEVIERGINNA